MSVTRILASSTLLFEAFAVFFGGLVAMRLSSLDIGTALAVFSVLALLCLFAAGTLRFSWGYWFGSALQVSVVATGFLTSSMFIVGGAFALLWISALVFGGRAERTAAERAAASPDTPADAPESS